MGGDAVDVVDVVARLKEESEVPLRSHGSLAMNRALMAAGLVDPVQLTIFPADPGGTALHLVGAHVGGSVHLDRGFTAQGLVTLAAATVGGDVCGIGGQFAHTLEATGTNIAGTLSRRDGFRCDGPVVRRGATAGPCTTTRSRGPRRARSRWLRRQRTPSALGYVQLATVYRASGDELWARRMLIERYNALLRPPRHWEAQLPERPTRPGVQAGALGCWVLRVTTGHGFAPGRSLLIAFPLAIALTAGLAAASHDDMLIPTDDTVAAGGEVPRSSACDDRYPCVQPFVYALDNLVPIVDLGQRSRWAPDQSHRGSSWWDDGRWLAAATRTTSALGWVLATLVAASFTQTVRRDRPRRSTGCSLDPPAPGDMVDPSRPHQGSGPPVRCAVHVGSGHCHRAGGSILGE